MGYTHNGPPSTWQPFTIAELNEKGVEWNHLVVASVRILLPKSQ